MGSKMKEFVFEQGGREMELVLTDDFTLTTKDGEPVRLTERCIKNLIRLTLPDLDDDDIYVGNSVDNHYRYTPEFRRDLYDDIYTDGEIIETSCTKIFSNFNIAIVLKRNFNTEKVKEVEIYLRGEDDEDLFRVHSEKLLKYLNPSVFAFLI